MKYRYNNNIYKLIRPLPHDLCKKVLIVFSLMYILPYIEDLLSTSKCSWGYRLAMDKGTISNVSSRSQLGLAEISN